MSSQSHRFVAVLSDDAIRAEAVSRALRERGISTRTYHSPGELASDPDPGAIDCILLDSTEPPLDPESVLQKTGMAGEGPPVIVLADRADFMRGARAVQAGVFDVLDRGEPHLAWISRFVGALTRAAERRGRSERAQAARARLLTLSPREREILDLVVHAKSNKEISSQLHLSPRTVENHRARILKKLQAESSMQLLRITLEAQGVELA